MFIQVENASRVFINTIWLAVLQICVYAITECVFVWFFGLSADAAVIPLLIVSIPLGAIYAYCCYRNYLLGEAFNLSSLTIQRIIPNSTYFRLAVLLSLLWAIPLVLVLWISSMIDYVDISSYTIWDQAILYSLMLFIICFAIYIRLGIRIGSLFPAAATGHVITRKEALELSADKRGKILIRILVGPFVTFMLMMYISEFFAPNDPNLPYSSHGFAATGFNPLEFAGGIVATIFGGLVSCMIVVIIADVFTKTDFDTGVNSFNRNKN
jgi:hypothetical protein